MILNLYFSKLFRSMTQTKLIPVPLSKKFNTYGSFIFGSSYKITKSTDKKNSVNLKGQIHSKSNIHLLIQQLWKIYHLVQLLTPQWQLR